MAPTDSGVPRLLKMGWVEKHIAEIVCGTLFIIGIIGLLVS